MKAWTDFNNFIIDKIDKNDISYTLFMALKHKYHNVYVHSVNVAYGSYYLAKMLDLPEDECEIIALGALFHDIGKINIVSKILYKPSALDANEWLIIKRHPQYGVNLLASSKYLPMFQNIILYHHERYDGKGYNKGLRSQMIPSHARIVSLCDCFDAMVSFRSYKKNLSIFQAKNELIENKDIHFDGKLVDKFMDMVDELYYVYCQSVNIQQLDKSEDNIAQFLRWQDIMEQLQDIGIMYLDQNEFVRYCNKQAAVYRGKEKKAIIGKSFYTLHKPHRAIILKKKFDKVHAGGTGWTRLMANKDEYIQNKYLAIKDKDNKHLGTVLITTNVTERENVLRGLEKTVNKLNLLVQAASLLAEVNSLEQIFSHMQYLLNKLWPVGTINVLFAKYKNKKYYNLAYRSVDKQLTEIFDIYLSNNICETKYIVLKNAMFIRKLMCFKNTNSCFIEIKLDKSIPVSADEMQIIEAIFNYLHIAIENHLLFVDIENMAIVDQMTGLYNRRYLENIKRSLLINKSLIVIMGDINNLKDCNDQYGHLIGDRLICGAAQIIKESIHTGDLAFRIGGDEFLILLTNSSEDRAKKLIQRIKQKMSLWKQNHVPIKMSLSVGYAAAYNGADIDEIIALADEKMYEEKQCIKKQSYSRGMS